MENLSRNKSICHICLYRFDERHMLDYIPMHMKYNCKSKVMKYALKSNQTVHYFIYMAFTNKTFLVLLWAVNF